MALIRTKPKNGLDEMPTFYDPAQQLPPQMAQPVQAPAWTVAQTPSPTPQTRQPSTAQPPLQWSMSAPMTNTATDDLLKKYQDTYGAPDKDFVLEQIKKYGTDDRAQWNDPTPAAPAAPAPPKSYNPMPGWEQTKLNDPSRVNHKYNFGRFIQDHGFDPVTARQNLQAIVDAYNQQYGANARAVNDDMVDFGDGFGPIDVLNAQNYWQWLPTGAAPMPTAPKLPTFSPTPTPGQTGTTPTYSANQMPALPNLSAPSAPQAQSATPLVTPQASATGQLPTIQWAPGTAHTWQAMPNTLPAFTRVANALSRALGREPTPEEVWAQLNYDKLPDTNFLNAIVNNILDTVKPDPATQNTAQGTPAASDPYLDEYKRYLDEYLKTLASQRDQKEQDAQGFRARQQQAQAATERLLAFLEERSKRLMQPAYTGAEGEVFRTQALDPIEADRQAAKQRALQRISERGLDPKSGIAQELLNQVDAAFDKSRAGTQNQLAYNQITEQRSREQEAQQLLGLVPTIQRAAINGDVELLDQLDRQIRSTYQEGMGPTQLKYNIPNDALQQALAALGVGTNPMQLLSMLMQQQQYNQGNSNALWGSLGSMLPYLLGAFSGGAGTGGGTMPAGWTGGT